ncbi:YhcN/YlaJ family sporulation lipoprotein [Cohnella sp. WQ 127256]|uniref:YhcN/YlaJ family sporulation lipoprotein n=1 Tax=Cohnella sp. WQ 127256 TaxID=2938790 RepID=UPI002118D7F6|nr:YhcN/YlaJ family sporulation lipoprotein [Cohnella sp. WQ 127256]
MLARRSYVLIVAALMLGLLTGCNYKTYFQNSNQDYGSRKSNDPKMMQVRSYGNTSSNPNQHDNRYFEYSSAISNKVAALPGINSAIVFLTDKNAYVAILTDWSATGTGARGGPRSNEQSHIGYSAGVNNVSNVNKANPHAVKPYNSLFTHKDYGDLSTELRQVIGTTVRRDFPRAQEVHISANREFNNQAFEFAKASWLKKSLAPITPQFNALVKYTFGTGNTIPLPLPLTQKPNQLPK